MYIKAADQQSGENAKLQLAVPMDYRSSSSCLAFYYHMSGATMGTLNVINGNDIIFTKSGDQGDYWRQVKRTVNLSDVVSTILCVLRSFFKSLEVLRSINSKLPSLRFSGLVTL